ncbi:Uma2 family endonuclease [bacterium]|nr:Uma2 family endonuclease [bacterium]
MSSVLDAPVQAERAIRYPESDGQPMADNTLQFQWIVLIKENLATLFHEREDVFVAGDLLWYPVEGQPKICRAPDTMVVLGRPKGYRGSYKQWEEDDLAPQVVFEVRSPANSFKEMLDKLAFYETYGVEEYYTYDPDPERNDLTGFQRQEERLHLIDEMNGWTSPRLGIRFDTSGKELRIFAPDGTPFRSHEEIEHERKAEQAARQQAEQERDAERAARQQAEQRAIRAEQEREHLMARLRELGVDPETMAE